MTINEAIKLIQPGIKSTEVFNWADLGCGSGMFTRALSQLLPPGSRIDAVDQRRQVIEPMMNGHVTVLFHQADFQNIVPGLPLLDGVLMANSLHYVRDKKEFLTNWSACFKDKKQWLIVEYDTERPNEWVPYPLSYQKCQLLFSGIGYTSITKLGTAPSIYGPGMYAALITE